MRITRQLMNQVFLYYFTIIRVPFYLIISIYNLIEMTIDIYLLNTHNLVALVNSSSLFLDKYTSISHDEIPSVWNKHSLTFFQQRNEFILLPKQSMVDQVTQKIKFISELSSYSIYSRIEWKTPKEVIPKYPIRTHRSICTR